MPEPLIHFVIPFFVLTMLGLNLKKSTLISFLAVVPDLDVIFHVHRSMSHSILFILAIFIPIVLILYISKKNLFKEAIIATFVIMSHPIMDVFTWYTPILWPLFNKSIYIFTEMTTNMNNIFALNLSFGIKLEDILFYKTSDVDAPIFTSQGVGMSLMLLSGLMLKYLKTNIHNITGMPRYAILGKFRNKK